MDNKDIKKLNIEHPGLIYQDNIIKLEIIEKIISLFNKDKQNKDNIINENCLVFWNGIKHHHDIDLYLYNTLQEYLQIYLNYYNQIKENIIDSGYLLINHDDNYISHWETPNNADDNINICVIIYALDNLEIEFKYINKKINMDKGSMIIFPSNFTYTYKINDFNNGSIIISIISYSKKP